MNDRLDVGRSVLALDCALSSLVPGYQRAEKGQLDWVDERFAGKGDVFDRAGELALLIMTAPGASRSSRSLALVACMNLIRRELREFPFARASLFHLINFLHSGRIGVSKFAAALRHGIDQARALPFASE